MICRTLGLVTAIGVSVSLARCSMGWACANTEESRTTSPDGSRDAVAFIRDCGATTDYSSQVALVQHGQPLADRSGNVFVYGHRTDLRLQWIAADTLRIRYATANPVRQESLVNGVTIVYGK